MWDETTRTQWAYFTGGDFVSFDNEEAICAKTEYVQQHDLNGFIIWEMSGVSRGCSCLFVSSTFRLFGSYYSGFVNSSVSGFQDLMPDLSTPLLDTVNVKLLNPDMKCAEIVAYI